MSSEREEEREEKTQVNIHAYLLLLSSSSSLSSTTNYTYYSPLLIRKTMIYTFLILEVTQTLTTHIYAMKLSSLTVTLLICKRGAVS